MKRSQLAGKRGEVDAESGVKSQNRDSPVKIKSMSGVESQERDSSLKKNYTCGRGRKIATTHRLGDNTICVVRLFSLASQEVEVVLLYCTGGVKILLLDVLSGRGRKPKGLSRTDDFPAIT